MTTALIITAVVLGVGLGTAVAVGRALRQAVAHDAERWQKLRDSQRRIDARLEQHRDEHGGAA